MSLADGVRSTRILFENMCSPFPYQKKARNATSIFKSVPTPHKQRNKHTCRRSPVDPYLPSGQLWRIPPEDEADALSVNGVVEPFFVVLFFLGCMVCNMDGFNMLQSGMMWNDNI